MMARLAAAGVVVLIIAIMLVVVPRFARPAEGDLANGLQAESELFAALAEHYPDDFTALIDEIEAVGDKPADVTRISTQWVTTFRLDHANDLLAAEDDALRAYITSMSLTHRAVKETFGVERCNQYAVYGASALGPFITNPGVLPSVNAQGAAMVVAFDSAKGRKVRPEATEEQWAAFFEDANTSEVTQNHIDLIAAVDSSHVGYCDAMLWFLDTLTLTDGATAEAVRASLARTVTSG
ncbi:MAG: hypothetical protein AAF608_14070 [Pseudomonadota bacterium]